jgi:hypothetical protein
VSSIDSKELESVLDNDVTNEEVKMFNAKFKEYLIKQGLKDKGDI